MKSLLQLFPLLPLLVFAQPRPLYYSFQTDGGGGIARIVADPETGEVREHTRVFQDARAAAIRKVAVSQDGRFVAANLEDVDDKENLVVVNLETGEATFHDFRRNVDHVDMFRDRLYIGVTDGTLHRMNPATGALEASWNFRRILDPSGRRPESFHFDTHTETVWVSFQKDSDSQNHRGSRIVGLDMKTDNVIADLQLPRDKPELHYDPAVRGREAGPSPEVLHVSAAHNLLFVTLDLYGGLGFADLDAARRGELKNWTVLSTAPDGSWGTAFPDRVGRFTRRDREYLIVANASRPGGAVIVDLERRDIIQRLDVPGGLTTLHYLPVADLIVSGAPGKIKSRGPTRLESVFEPPLAWHIFVPGEQGFRVHAIPRDAPVHRVAPVHAPTSPLVHLNFGENKDHWEIRDPREDSPRSSFRPFGEVQRTGQ